MVVEDHSDLRELTCLALSQRGHQVIGLSCAEEVDEQLKQGAVDVFILDLNLPGEDGISLGKRIRHTHPQVGIIMLTARSQNSDKVLGYESGADLYMTKPVNFDELCAAIQSFARRRQITTDGLSLNKFTLSGPLGDVHVTSSEADLLVAFSLAPDGRLETWQLTQLLGYEPGTLNKSSLEVRIVRLRKKISEAGATGAVIESIRNVGYQFCAPLRVV